MARSKKRSRREKLHPITDKLRRDTARAFKLIKAAQKNLDLKIGNLHRELLHNTFKPPYNSDR